MKKMHQMISMIFLIFFFSFFFKLLKLQSKAYLTMAYMSHNRNIIEKVGQTDELQSR